MVVRVYILTLGTERLQIYNYLIHLRLIALRTYIFIIPSNAFYFI